MGHHEGVHFPASGRQDRRRNSQDQEPEVFFQASTNSGHRPHEQHAFPLSKQEQWNPESVHGQPVSVLYSDVSVSWIIGRRL